MRPVQSPHLVAPITPGFSSYLGQNVRFSGKPAKPVHSRIELDENTGTWRIREFSSALINALLDFCKEIFSKVQFSKADMAEKIQKAFTQEGKSPDLITEDMMIEAVRQTIYGILDECDGSEERLIEALTGKTSVPLRVASPEATGRSLQFAVEKNLLPKLPSNLRNIEALGEEVTPEAVFLSLLHLYHAIRELLRDQYPRAKATFEMDARGTLISREKELSSQSVTQIIADKAIVSPEAAVKILNWVVQAARTYPALFAFGGLQTQPWDRGVQFTVTEWPFPALSEYWEFWSDIPTS